MTLGESLTIAATSLGVLLTAIIYLHTRRSAVLHEIRDYIQRLDTVGGRSVHALEARVTALEEGVGRNTRRIDRLTEQRRGIEVVI